MEQGSQSIDRARVSLDELRAWLVADGFRFAEDPLAPRESPRQYAYRRSAIPARECECNDGKPMQILARPYSFDTPGGVRHESVTVELTGEYDGQWWKLQAYSLSFSEVCKTLPAIEMKLIRAWNQLEAA